MSHEKSSQEENEKVYPSTEVNQESQATSNESETNNEVAEEAKVVAADDSRPEEKVEETGKIPEVASEEKTTDKTFSEEEKITETTAEEVHSNSEETIVSEKSEVSEEKEIVVGEPELPKKNEDSAGDKVDDKEQKDLEKTAEKTSPTYEDPIASKESDTSDEEEEEEEVESSEDEEPEEDKEEQAQKDYSSLSKKELIAEFDKLLKSRKIQDIKPEAEEIRSEFNNKFNEELEQKKRNFLADGGNIIDFHYTTPLKTEFNSLYFDYKEKRNNYYKNLKKDLQGNLAKRWELIEDLKSLLSAEENINTTYKHFKEIQEKWHLAGAIPRDKYNTVWNTYHHHVENFYDFLHLNREFRDLDFKHNLDAKLKLITRAEELAHENDINKAFRELQMLHKMWKEDIGPVAKEYRDEVWDKFSEATKLIHDKRQNQLAEMEKEFHANYEKKKEIIEALKKTTEETKPSHQGWQNAIKTVQGLRDDFFKTGRVPRNHNKEIWKAFKDATSAFNNQKNSFYKNQKKEQYSNLEKKKRAYKNCRRKQGQRRFRNNDSLDEKDPG